MSASSRRAPPPTSVWTRFPVFRRFIVLPKSFLGRSAGLAAVTAALALGAAGVADAALIKAYDFHSGSLQASFDSANSAPAALAGVGTANATFGSDQGYQL